MADDQLPKPGATPFVIESIRMLAPNSIGIRNYSDDDINRAVLAYNPDWHKPFDWIGFNIFLKAAKEDSFT
jgi:hypothetical protein